MQRDLGSFQGRSLADTLRLRGLAGDAGAASLEEQLLLQQQQGLANQGLLSQLRDQNILNQLGQQHHLASLLGLGGVGGGNDVRSMLAAAQMRQQQAQTHQPQPQLTHADLLALSRSGVLPGLSGILGSTNLGGGGHAAGLASELEGLQRLEELERRQRLLNASQGPLPGTLPRSPEAPPIHQSAPAAARAPTNDRHIRAEPTPSSAPSRKVQEDEESAGAGPAADSAGKEEVEKTPGSVIVPCRARGMPMDHNFKTAYFVIPENVKHGEELICSYFACRNAGIKFRYCSHCKVPVAKRNFRKRHKHGGEIIAGEDSDGDEDKSSVKKGIPSQIMANREEAGEADALSSQSADSDQNAVSDSEAQKNSEVQKGLVRSSMRNFEESKHSKAGEDDSISIPVDLNGNRKISVEREKRWSALLAKRPSTKDGDSMSNWLMEVLAVSDLETPLKANDDDDNDNDDHSPAPAPAPVPAGSDSQHSDRGSSNSESSKEAKKDNAVPVIVRKKRPAEFLNKGSKNEEADVKDKSKSFAGGSFAEWKERKKQRKQSKSWGASGVNDE